MKQVATEMKPVATEMKPVATEMKQAATEMKQVATEMKQVATEMSTSSWRSVQYGTHCWNVASCAALQSPFGGSQPSFRMFGSCQASYCDCVTCIGVATCCAKFCGKMQSANPLKTIIVSSFDDQDPSCALQICSSW
jgi:hypothetical protein